MTAAVAIASIREAGFSLNPEIRDRALRVAFAGNGDMTTVPVLATFLKDVHTEARRQAVQEVVFDFNDLYFLNSACFKSFVTWITQVAALDPSSRYRIKFLSNPRLLWQRRSLEALRCLASDVVLIES